MILGLDEFDEVRGEIYKITNTVTNKSYIGQTRTHRLNHAKYRPFGYMGRFKDHIHEAFSNKKNVSRYLNSSIQKYGSDKFKCELLLTCEIEELDTLEQKYISELNTKFPNGYNLTDGGRTFCKLKTETITLVPQPTTKPRRGSKRSDDTKALISARLKEATNSEDVRKKLMENAQRQHLQKKFDRFRDVTVDKNDIDKYIHIVRNNKLNYEYVRVVIQKVKTSFVGKFEPISQIKERAITFINELIEWQDTLLLETP